jgi:hypothetical protein
MFKPRSAVSTTVYVVAEVWRGIASDVHVFLNEQDAKRVYHRLAAGINEDEEDVQMFEKQLLEDVATVDLPRRV